MKENTMIKPFFPNDINTASMLAEVAAHQIRPEKDMPDVHAVILAFAYDQETDPANTEIVHEWVYAFPSYADELLAVSYARIAMGWRIDDDVKDGEEDEEIAAIGREIIRKRNHPRDERAEEE